MAAEPPGEEKFKAPLDGTPKITSPLSPYRFHLIMALVAVVILVGGYVFYYFQEQQMRQRIEGGLSIMAQLKVDQIVEWRAERLVDANVLVGSPFFTEGVAKYMASPTDTETKDRVLAKLAVIDEAYPYQDILLADVNGEVLLSLNDNVHRLSDMTLAQLAIAIKEHEAVITDFHYPPDGDSPHLDVVAPLFPWGQDSPQAIGAVVFCIDPAQYLYPLLQSSPMPSETAETLLVERDGDQVLFLNELRHQKDTAFKLRIPLSQQEVPAVMAVTGKEGIVEGKDYRGVEVLAVLKHIPDSPWYLVAKIDISEALAAWRSRASMILAFFAGLLIAALAGIGFIWQRRRRLEYQALYQAEEALRLSMERYRILFDININGLCVIDETMKVLLVNEAAAQIFGFESVEEALGVNPFDFVPSQERERVLETIKNDMFEKDERQINEFQLVNKSGKGMWVSAVGAIIGYQGKPAGLISFTDITERKHGEEQLRDSEVRYRRLFETAQDAILILDGKTGTINDANPFIKDMLGYTQEELQGKHLWEIGTFQDIVASKAAYEELKEEGYVRYEHLPLQSKDGRIVHVEVVANRYKVNHQEVFQCNIRDITGRKRMEESLRRSEQNFRDSIENSPLGIRIVTEDGETIYANRALLDICGYSNVEELKATPTRERYTPESYAEHKERQENRRRGEFVPADYEVSIVRKSGEVRHLAVSRVEVQWNGKRQFQVVYQDITERKQAEEMLWRSEERYRTILEEMEESYYEVDLAGNFTFVNDSLCRRLGRSREELIGMSYRDYTPRERSDDRFKTFNRVYRTGEPVKGIPAVAIARDGSLIFTERSIFPLRDERGKIIGFRGISRDVTERKMAEEERMRLELKAQATSRLASVGEMAAGVAHEINNPLTAVTGYAQLLVDRDDVPPDIRADLAAINDGARRVAGIVKRLLAFSRQTKPERKLVDINEIIESTLILRAYHLRVNNIEVLTRLAPDWLETVVDPGQIQQVLLNLIVNAETEMKLAHGKGKLIITTEKKDNTIKIYVKDNGPGIKPEVMDKIFDPFFTTREVGQGTGLGLSLCYGIVTEHQGKIYVESKSGKGATFIVELPVVTEVAPLKPAEPVIKRSKKAVKARILVVDDEQVVRDVVNRVLTGEGHRVETVDNAADALEKIESQKYDLMLVDIKMPGMSGVTLYKRIQKIDKSLAQRVVFMTGDIMGADTEEFLSQAKVSHIEKPFNAEQLSRQVKRALSGGL